MISSSEFIKGYTKIIICAYLFRQRDYLYNIVKNIKNGEWYVKISNSSALIAIKEMEKDSLVSYDIEISIQNQERKYYALTEKGKNFYLSNRNYYIKSLHLLQIMIGDDYENRISNNKKKSKK